MKELNINFAYSKNAFEKDMMDSSSIKSRIADLHNAFQDKRVSGIICVRGGYNSNTLLPYINWNFIKKNPKPFLGYSDITVLSNAIYAKTGLITYSGPNFSSFGVEHQKTARYIIENWKKCLMSDEPFNITSGEYFGERKIKPRKNKGMIIFQKGNAEGILIGGNLCSLNLLQGTEYMPSLKNTILFLEEDDFGGKTTPLEFERNLESLLQLPNVNTIKGIVFGRFQKGASMTVEKLKFILSSKNISKNIPIIANADFGHTNPIFTFPIGGTVKIEVKNKKIEIKILKH